MKKVEVNLVALTNSETHPGHFVMVLEDLEMKRRLPITIGPVEAQAIAMYIEKMKPARPQTHDLFHQTILALGAKLEEVLISEVVDETYHSKIVFNLNGNRHTIDSRTSDAVALAIRFDCPVYAIDNILESTGFNVDAEGLPVEKRGSLFNFPLNELESLLDKVLKKEDYESATRIRDAINKKRLQ